MATDQPLHEFLCWGKASLLNNLGHITTVPACNSVDTPDYTNPQTQVMAPHPVPVYRHRANLSMCYPLMCVVITTFLSWKFSTMRVLCGHALSSWKMKPESTAAIPKGITTGYNEMVTQMHSQTRLLSTAIDLIPVIFFHAPQTV